MTRKWLKTVIAVTFLSCAPQRVTKHPPGGSSHPTSFFFNLYYNTHLQPSENNTIIESKPEGLWKLKYTHKRWFEIVVYSQKNVLNINFGGFVLWKGSICSNFWIHARHGENGGFWFSINKSHHNFSVLPAKNGGRRKIYA